MGYATLRQALYWLEEPTGLTVKDNRCELVDKLNKVRQWIYLQYGEIDTFLDGEECIALQKFCLDCNCEETYVGFTLPPEYDAVEAIWLNDIPIKMYDKWREYREGIASSCSQKLAIYDAGDIFPTERDIYPCGSCTPVKFKAESVSDYGKLVSIRYIDSNGQEVDEDLKLADGYVKTSRAVKQIKQRGGIVLPNDLEGSIWVAQENGRVLSYYDPHQSIPSFRRMKVVGAGEGDQVWAKLSRKFRPLYFDTDVIETDNRLVIEEAARFFRFNESTKGDVSYEQKAASHQANARRYLLGEKGRERGRVTISNFRLSTGRPNSSGLNRNRRSLWGVRRFR